jgi:uncharacterized lipoprotein YbaY
MSIHPVYGPYLMIPLLLLAGCGSSQSDWVVVTPVPDTTRPQVHITGVVRHLAIEGGLYVIRGDDSVNYNPTNLPSVFQQEGLPVEAYARSRGDMAGIHQIGPLVQLERIRLRGAAPTTLRGTVTYRQRTALPAGAIVTVEFVDVSPGNTPRVIGSQTIETRGEQVPIPFFISLDPAKLDRKRPYGVRATITVAGLLFASPSIQVIALEQLSVPVEVVVEPAR